MANLEEPDRHLRVIRDFLKRADLFFPDAKKAQQLIGFALEGGFCWWIEQAVV